MALRLSSFRLLLLASCVVLAVLAAREAAIAYFRPQHPSSALQLSRDDGRTRLLLAESRIAEPNYIQVHADEIASAARAALRDNPLDAMALRQLAQAKQLDASVGARQLVALSDEVSRRDLVAQLWQAENALEQGELDQAMAYFDVALSVHREVHDPLFAALVERLAEGAVQDALATYGSRPWFVSFAAYAIRKSDYPVVVVALLRKVGGRLGQSDQEDLSAQLLARLVAKGDYAGARDYALGLRGAGPGLFLNMGFSGNGIDQRFAPLSWSLIKNAGIGAEGDGSGNLLLTVTPGKTGQAAERLTYWVPGTYALTQMVSYDTGTAMAQLLWKVECLTGGESRLVWQQFVPVRQGRMTYRSNVQFPSGCNVQRWRLIVSAEDGYQDSAARVQLAAWRLVG